MIRIASTIIHAARAVDRAENVRELLAALPRSTVVTDDGVTCIRGCWPVARLAWMRDVGDATHHLVVEDDAVLCEGFAELAATAIGRRPDAMIVYFYGWRGCSVATSMPVDEARRWLTWAAGETRHEHHDLMQVHGARELGIPLAFANPSLVEHGRFPSLLGHGHCASDNFTSRPSSFVLEVH